MTHQEWINRLRAVRDEMLKDKPRDKWCFHDAWFLVAGRDWGNECESTGWQSGASSFYFKNSKHRTPQHINAIFDASISAAKEAAKKEGVVVK